VELNLKVEAVPIDYGDRRRLVPLLPQHRRCHGNTFYLENPIRHCKVELPTLYIYSIARICDECYCLSLVCLD